jgi:hypothetical protein
MRKPLGGQQSREESSQMAQSKPRLSSDPGPRFEAATAGALGVLRRAADEWAKGHPEEPATEAVLQEILRIFEKEHFLRRPF